jgi:hypothetical protein
MSVRRFLLSSAAAPPAAFFSMTVSAVPVTYASDGTPAITAIHRQTPPEGDCSR